MGTEKATAVDGRIPLRIPDFDRDIACKIIRRP